MDGEATRNAGRSVRLFLADGNVHGIVIAEVGNWNGKVLAAPRSSLSDLLRRPEAGRAGIYVMTGPDPDRVDGILAYVREADDLAKRMPNHLRSEAKDFADRFAFVVSSDETLTKGHVRYLEGRLIRLVTEAGSARLANFEHHSGGRTGGACSLLRTCLSCRDRRRDKSPFRATSGRRRDSFA